jgi:FkbM family methyltransferase
MYLQDAKKPLKHLYEALPMKAQLFRALRGALPNGWHLPKSIFEHLHFKAVIRVPVGNTSFLVRHHGYYVENSLFWEGLYGSSWEGQSMRLWTRLCADSRLIVDVGANTGVYSLVAKALNPSARVVAFEPMQRVFQKLVANCELNSYDVHCVPLALSNIDGAAKVFDALTEHLYSVTLGKNMNAPGVPVIEREIDATRLDSFFRTERLDQRLDLMKIDVETHEAEVLEGMGEILHRDRPSLLIELLNEDVAAKVESLLPPNHYRFFNISETSGPKEQEHLSEGIDFNFLVCSREVAGNLGL